MACVNDDSTEIAIHAEVVSVDSVVCKDTYPSDVVQRNSDPVATENSDHSDAVTYEGADSSYIVASKIGDPCVIFNQESTDPDQVSDTAASKDGNHTDIVDQVSTDPLFVATSKDMDPSDIVASKYGDHSYFVEQVSTYTSDVVSNKNTDSSNIIVSKYGDHSYFVEQVNTDPSGVYTNKNINSSDIVASDDGDDTNIVDQVSTDLSYVVTNETMHPSDIDMYEGTDSPDTVAHGSTDLCTHGNIDQSNNALHGNTDLLGFVVSGNSETSLKKETESKDSRNLFSLVTVKNFRTSLPDNMPSRRSIRKKQSTFSDDFEYYTPGIKRKEIKFEQTSTALKIKHNEGYPDDGDDDDEDQNNYEELGDGKRKKKPAKKKTTERSKKVEDSDENDDDDDDSSQNNGDNDNESDEDSSMSGKRKTKFLVKKKNKGGSVKKSKKKNVEKQSEDEESNSEIDGKKVVDRHLKRKKVATVSKHNSKKVKIVEEQEEESSDEEESTPISQLRAQLRKKKEEEMRKIMLQGQSLLERFGDDDVSKSASSDKSPGPGLKRKLSNSGEGVPSKMPKAVQIDRLVPALTSLMKLIPAPGRELVKQSPSESNIEPEVVSKTVQSKHTDVMKDDRQDRKSSDNKNIDSSFSGKMKVTEGLPKKKLSDSGKIEQGTSVKMDTKKIVSKIKNDSHLVKKVDTAGERLQSDLKMKGEGKYVTKIIRKPDGTIIKRKVVISEERIIRDEDKKIKMNKSHEKDEKKKQLSGSKLQKEGMHGLKTKSPAGSVSDRKLEKDLAKEGKIKIETRPSGGEDVKHTHSFKKIISEHKKKLEQPIQKIDDLLKRGIIHKRKSHQPFGHKKVVKVPGKDLKAEAVQDVSVKQELVKKKQKIPTLDDMKTLKGKGQKKSSEASKHSRSDSCKGAKRKSTESRKHKLEKSKSNTDLKEVGDDMEPPTLVPVTAMGRHKVRHHKSEHEVPLDMTMMDLFKPDNPPPQDMLKSEEVDPDEKPWEQNEMKSQYPENVYDIHSFVKPENLLNVLIEHQYSKPISSLDSNRDDQKMTSTSLDVERDNDIESISHKKTDFMDMSLPDQILEETNEPSVVESTVDLQETWATTKEEFHHMMSKRNVGDRPSILESLDNELKESGTEFLIVGQVEVGRLPLTIREESVGKCETSPTFKDELQTSIDNNSDVIKASEENQKSHFEKINKKGSSDAVHKKSISDSTKSSLKDRKYSIDDKRSNSSERKSNNDNKKSNSKDRKSSTEDKKSSSNDRKSSTEDKKLSSKDRKSSTEDKKSSSNDRKSSTEDKKSSSKDKKSSIDDKNYSSKDKKSSIDDKKITSKDKKSSIDDKKITSKDKKSSIDDKKSSSKDRKSSIDDKKSSSIKLAYDSKKIADVRQDSLDTKDDKIKKITASGSGSKQVGEIDEEDDSSEEHRFKDDENDLDWEPNDADTVYCICRKPHNNRFMICCDQCEEWFHGTCVGISRARGKEMEDREEEYICPVCLEGAKESTDDKAPISSLAADVELAKPKLLQRCVGRKCVKTPRPGSVYCSNECIMSHAQESLKAIRDEEHFRKKTTEKQPSNDSSRAPSMSSTTSATTSVTASTVEVVERETGKILAGSSAPTQKGLHRWLEQHPTFEVVQPHKHHSKSSSSNKQSRTDKEKKSSSDKDRHTSHRDKHSDRSKDSGKKGDAERQNSTSSQKSDTISKTDEKRDDGPDQIRINVRTALRDCLITRAQEADDILLTSIEIKSLAVTIEEELFAMFNDTGHKYRTRYRSLVFNIKDQKNKGLFRKILTGMIKPHKLVQMSTEELASRELAKWREQASKHQLEMIEKTEQAALKESEEGVKHIRKKTHKGEVEVEDEDLSTLETRLEEKKDVEPEPQLETQSPTIDTTDQHRAHLFDLNCKVCTGKIVPGREEQRAVTVIEKKEYLGQWVMMDYDTSDITPTPSEQIDVQPNYSVEEDTEDYEKAEEIVKEALRTMQKMEESVLSLPKMVSISPVLKEITPPQSPKLISHWESSSSVSSVSSSSMRKRVVVRSPDSALQTGLEAKPKFVPTGPMLWKGFLTMLDVAKFFTSAYRVSGPIDHITIPDTIKILGRISPDHMWDYLSKIRQAGSKDLTVIRFIPGNDDEKVAYVHLYSYLNSRSRCGVAANPNKQVKDFYIVPLASYGKIPRTLMPFDGPGLEENRPHMLIGILVRQRGKHGTETTDTNTTGSVGSVKPTNQSSTSSGTKYVIPPVNRDPRLAKFAAKEASPRLSPSEGSSSSSNSSVEAKPKVVEEYEPEYIPMPIRTKSTYKPVAEYIPTPTIKKSSQEKEGSGSKKEERMTITNERKIEMHHHHKNEDRDKKMEVKEEKFEDDSDPYSPGKETEPYSPGQEAAADEPYDPADDSLMDDSDVRIISSSIVSSTTVSSSSKVITAIASSVDTAASTGVDSSLIASQSQQPGMMGVNSTVHNDADLQTNELVEKMACSNDPQEISSLMVMALSTTQSSQEQQRLLVELTKKVEDRKLQLVEVARLATSEDSSRVEENEKVEGSGVSSSGITARVSSFESSSQTAEPGITSLAKPSDGAGREHFPEETVSSSSSSAPSLPALEPSKLGSTTKESKNPARISFSILSSKTLQPLSTHTAADFVLDDMSSQENLPKLNESTSLQAPFTGNSLSMFNTKPPETAVSTIIEAIPQTSTFSQTAVFHTKTESSGDIPDALKALMNDVMGNTQFSSLEKRRKMLLKKEGKKAEMAVKETARADEDKMGHRDDDAAQVQKGIIVETNGMNVTDSVVKLDETSSINDSSVALTIGENVEPVVADAKKEPVTMPPSIDELLDRLKRGGFQFPLQKAESAGHTSSTVVTTSQINPIISSNSLPLYLSGQSAITSTASSSVSAAATSTDTLSSTSDLDTDLRQKNKLPYTSSSSSVETVTASDVITSSVIDPISSSYRDLTPRSLSVFQDYDDREFTQDQDDRQFKPVTPKHPLDPYAFPPLPGDTQVYPPPLSRPSLPLPHGPLHPRFPLPDSTPVQAQLVARAEPPPSDTEKDKPLQAETTMDSYPSSDVDFRNRSQTPVSADRKSPPLPPQPPPSLPRLPGNRGHYPHPSSRDKDNSSSRYSSSRDTSSHYHSSSSRDRDHRNSRYQSSSDRDYRSGRSYRSPNNRRSDYHKSRDDRHYHRH